MTDDDPCYTGPNNSQITAWLCDIPSPPVAKRTTSSLSPAASPPWWSPSQSRSRSRKRRRDCPQSIPKSCVNPLQSPPASDAEHDGDRMSDTTGPAPGPRTPRSKRRKVAALQGTAHALVEGGGEEDEDEGEEQQLGDADPTPRARKTPSLASEKTRTTGSSISQKSGTSSPTKHFQTIALQDDGIKKRTLKKAASGLPDELSRLLETFEDVSNGFGIISSAEKATLQDRATIDPTLPNFRDYMFAADSTRNALGPTPSLDAVLSIVRWATYCSEKNAHEDTWNAYVHFPLLCLAVYGSSELKPQLMNVNMCTHADIIQEYRHLPIPSKRVDFVLHCTPSSCPAGSDPEQEPRPAATAAAIDRVRRNRPLVSINHTDLACVLDGPICTSIETKRPHRAGDEAELQIGVWHAAQWTMLSQMAAAAAAAAAPGGAGAGGRGLGGCAFLPGVIISGHEWRLVATTREGRRTVLWTDCLFGSSRDVLGVYKIVCAVQHLVRDGLYRYWPWFRRSILGIVDADGP